VQRVGTSGFKIKASLEEQKADEVSDKRAKRALGERAGDCGHGRGRRVQMREGRRRDGLRSKHEYYSKGPGRMNRKLKFLI